jgi:3-oxoadipate enol-lactonase
MPRLDLDGVTLHYHDEGAGEPVVLVHGFPLSSDLWTPQRAALSADHRVITPDLRGFGGSDALHGTPSMDVYADDIVAILDELGVAQATVAGLSMGGYVTMALLRRRPDRVRGVMLVATKMTPDTPQGRQGRDDMIALAQTEGAGAVADKMLPNMLTERTRADDAELVTFAREMMASASVDGIVAALTALRERPDSTATLQSLDIPVLVVVGQDDKLTTVDDATAMHNTAARSRLEIIRDAAHLVNLEQPGEVNRVMLDFLQRTTDH